MHHLVLRSDRDSRWVGQVGDAVGAEGDRSYADSDAWVAMEVDLWDSRVAAYGALEVAQAHDDAAGAN